MPLRELEGQTAAIARSLVQVETSKNLGERGII
jgi:hypothetical protein